MAKRKPAGETGILARETFGEFSRYRLDTFRDRFGSTVFFVADAERLDDLGLPAIIRQCATRNEALAGLK